MGFPVAYRPARRAARERAPGDDLVASHPDHLSHPSTCLRVVLRGGPMILSVGLLREVLRNYQSWRSLYEAREVGDTITCDGYSLTLWDVEYLILNLKVLPPRQRQAIQFCLIENMRETDAAVRMGVSPTNPVSAYAASGLSKIIAMVQADALPRFREAEDEREVG